MLNAFLPPLNKQLLLRPRYLLLPFRKRGDSCTSPNTPCWRSCTLVVRSVWGQFFSPCELFSIPQYTTMPSWIRTEEPVVLCEAFIAPHSVCKPTPAFTTRTRASEALYMMGPLLGKPPGQKCVSGRHSNGAIQGQSPRVGAHQGGVRRHVGFSESILCCSNVTYDVAGDKSV